MILGWVSTQTLWHRNTTRARITFRCSRRRPPWDILSSKSRTMSDITTCNSNHHSQCKRAWLRRPSHPRLLLHTSRSSQCHRCRRSSRPCTPRRQPRPSATCTSPQPRLRTSTLLPAPLPSPLRRTRLSPPRPRSSHPPLLPCHPAEGGSARIVPSSILRPRYLMARRSNTRAFARFVKVSQLSTYPNFCSQLPTNLPFSPLAISLRLLSDASM
mmetsp:Transcript_29759/g.62610  ORF Transcript_29759/g.62610 Transcript_29759/m.62610 type:complete len:214 (-) Transcript_29759:293-934(-)